MFKTCIGNVQLQQRLVAPFTVLFYMHAARIQGSSLELPTDPVWAGVAGGAGVALGAAVDALGATGAAAAAVAAVPGGAFGLGLLEGPLLASAAAAAAGATAAAVVWRGAGVATTVPVAVDSRGPGALAGGTSGRLVASG